VACCALAAFLISQIIFGLDWARERMGLRDAVDTRDNLTVCWRLDGTGLVAAAPVRPNPIRSRLKLAAVGGGIAFVVLAGLTLRAEQVRSWSDLTAICTGHGLVRLHIG
jgi:hypothetical protein